MKFRFVFWDVLPCKIIVDRRLSQKTVLNKLIIRYEAAYFNQFLIVICALKDRSRRVYERIQGEEGGR
jgi:hypothetical protein